MKRCMIVDDSSVIRKVVSRILAGPDMIVVEAPSAGDALAMCAAELPDVVIVDSRLPDMACDELIRRIATLDPAFRPHIIICMTEFDVGTIMRARRAGARGHMLKPFSRAQLLESFRDMQAAA